MGLINLVKVNSKKGKGKKAAQSVEAEPLVEVPAKGRGRGKKAPVEPTPKKGRGRGKAAEVEEVVEESVELITEKRTSARGGAAEPAAGKRTSARGGRDAAVSSEATLETIPEKKTSARGGQKRKLSEDVEEEVIPPTTKRGRRS